MANKREFLFLAIVFLVFALPFAFAWTPTGSDSGTLEMGSGSGSVYVSGPGQQPSHYCGNGIKESYLGEQCDGSDFGEATCSTLFSGYTGNLVCSLGCTYNTNNCQQSTNGGGGDGSGGGGGGGGGSNNGFSTSGSATDCAENWECSDWGICSGLKQSRTCNDLSNCKTSDLKPVTERSCSVEGAKGEAALGVTKLTNKSSSSFFGGITGQVIGGLTSPKVYLPLSFIVLVAGASLFIIVAKKKKSPEEDD